MKTEKLDALAAQAGFDVARLRAPYPGGFPREDMLALESLVELVVLECAEVADNADATRETWQNISAFIKQHFGVK